MKSRTDIALGKPLGLWFPPRNGDASFVRLTKHAKAETLVAHEEVDNGDGSGDGGNGSTGTSYADERARAFD